MRRSKEARNAANFEKVKKAAPTFGIQIGLQDQETEIKLVRLLTREASLVRRLGIAQAKIAGFRKACNPHRYGASDRCLKCGQRSPGWTGDSDGELA